MRHEDPLGLVPGVCATCHRIRKRRFDGLRFEGATAAKNGLLISLSGAEEGMTDCSVPGCPKSAFAGLNPQKASIFNGIGCRAHFLKNFNGVLGGQVSKAFGPFSFTNARFNWKEALNAVKRLERAKPAGPDEAAKLLVQEARRLYVSLHARPLPVHTTYCMSPF